MTMVFVLCLAVMILTGSARFSGQPFAAGVWLDAVFLISAGICLSLVIIRLGRRLNETAGEHIAEQEALEAETFARRASSDDPNAD